MNSAADILLESQDLDACLGYLSLVSGIDGALLFDQDGWIVGAGEETRETLRIEAPYLLHPFQELLHRFGALGLEPLESQLVFGDEKFHLTMNLERKNRFFLVISGSRGSYELFKYRVERGAQAIGGLLRDRGYFRS